MSKIRTLCSCNLSILVTNWNTPKHKYVDTSKCSLLRGKFGFACPVVGTGYKAMMLVARNMVLFCTIDGITCCIATFYWVKQRSKRWHKKPSEGFPSTVNFSTHEDSKSTSESSISSLIWCNTHYLPTWNVYKFVPQRIWCQKLRVFRFQVSGQMIGGSHYLKINHLNCLPW